MSNKFVKIQDSIVYSFAEMIAHQQTTKELSQEEFFNKWIVNYWEIINNNYKRPPQLFHSLSIFYVMAAKAFVKAYPDISFTYESLTRFLYQATFFSDIINFRILGSCPDVAINEAGRILKSINLLKTTSYETNL